MLKTVLMVVLCLLSALPRPIDPLSDAFHRGELLRLHVLADDDSAQMQAMKLPVRDAVRNAYAAQADPTLTMLENAELLLPSLTKAAEAAAHEAGFDGDVTLMLGTATFDLRELDGYSVAAGDYPALIVRLGRGMGRNWWGLIDPQRSLDAACIDMLTDGAIRWDWSLDGLWKALLHRFTQLRRGAWA